MSCNQLSPPSLRFLPGFHLRQVSAFESMNEMLSAVQSHFLYWENEAASRWVCMSTVGDKEEKLQVDLNLMSWMKWGFQICFVQRTIFFFCFSLSKCSLFSKIRFWGVQEMDLAYHSFWIRSVSGCGCSALQDLLRFIVDQIYESLSQPSTLDATCEQCSNPTLWVTCWVDAAPEAKPDHPSERSPWTIQLPPLQSVSQTKTPASGKTSRVDVWDMLPLHLYTFTAWFLTDLYLIW